MTAVSKIQLLDRIISELHAMIDAHLGLMVGLGGEEEAKAEALCRTIVGQVVDAGPSMFFHDDNIKTIEGLMDTSTPFRVLMDKIAGRVALLLTFSGHNVIDFIAMVSDSVISKHDPSSAAVVGIFPAMFKAAPEWIRSREHLYLVCLYLVIITFDQATWNQLFEVVAPEAKN